MAFLDIHEDAGHTFVHFLHSGTYETINSPLEEGTSDITREYKKSVLVYQASRTYDLSDLEVMAKEKLERLGENMPIREILEATRDVFSSLSTDETWLLGYLERRLQRFCQFGRPDLGVLYDVLGQDHRFDNTIMKIMLEILSTRLLSSDVPREGKSPL